MWSPARLFVRILFLARGCRDVEPYVQALERAQGGLSFQVARNTSELEELLHVGHHDAVVCDDGLGDRGLLDALLAVRRHDSDVPILVMTGVTELARGTEDQLVAEYFCNGATDCVDKNRPHLLGLAVALAVEERALRDERARAENRQARYRALAEHPIYGRCRCDVDGRLRDVNETMATMLGYSSRADLSGVSVTHDLVRHPHARTQWLEAYRRPGGLKGLEIEWVGKAGRLIPVRVSGRRVCAGAAALGAVELIVEDLTAPHTLQQQLRQEANTDGLTGLANYRCFAAMVDAEMQRADRTGRSCAVLLCGLNAMKPINDQRGDVAGPTAHRRFAGVLRRSCRSIDTPARYGGNEFAVLLPEAGTNEASAVGDRLHRILAADSEQPVLAVSLGSAVFPGDGDTVEHLLAAASDHLYLSKANRFLR